MTKKEALKLARTALGVQLDALLGKAGHLRNDDRKRYAENGIKAIDEALAQPEHEPDYSICPICGGMALDPIVPKLERFTPPQRKPLTDEMTKQMRESCDSYEMRGAFVDGWLSAEAAHGIKGEA